MVDKSNYCQTPVFQDMNCTKYPANTFAAADHLQKNYGDINQINEETSFNCSHCELTFVDAIEYDHHNLTLHGKGKMSTCNVCNAIFRRPDHLKRHIQSLHTNLKYCDCPVCGKDCKRQDILLKHIKRKHSSSTEIFRCRECNFNCNNLTELEKHETEAHLLTERHSCPQCQVTFKRRDHMLRHVKSQHLNQLVYCPICGQTYKRKDHVVRHVREKHHMGLLNGKLLTSSDF